MSIIQPRPARYNAVLPLPFPQIPEPAASVQCERCSWAWRRDRMQLKTIARSCAIHAMYSDAP